MVRHFQNVFQVPGIKRAVVSLLTCPSSTVILWTLLISVPSYSQADFSDGMVDRKYFQLHYKQFGNRGDWAVILSGGPGSLVGYMQPVADSLRQRFRCIMLEQRGTGRSVLPRYDSSTIRMDLYVEDLEALRKHLKTERLTLIGNSWGAMLALLYGAEHPDHVKKIIILGPGILSDRHARIFNDNLRIRYFPHEKEVRDYWNKKTDDPTLFVKANYERDKAGMAAYYYDRTIGQKAAENLKISDTNYYVFPAFFQAHPTFDIRPLLSAISAPVLIVQGRQEPGGDANGIETQQLIENATLKFIERCGHTPWEEKPNETWVLVNGFLGIN